MKRLRFSAALCLFVFLPCLACAELTFLAVGNPGNAADPRMMDDGTTGYGDVDYLYAISRYAVSNADWARFEPEHASHFAGDSKPVQDVTWYEAAQYCNWLTSGNRYSGAYVFTQEGTFDRVDREAALAKLLNGDWQRLYVLPTEDEWHKAAFYNTETDTYQLYATRTNTPPTVGTEANYAQQWPYDGPWNVGDGAAELNGTYNMTGNVWEWTETAGGAYKTLRGGAYDTQDVFCLSASYHNYAAVAHGEYDQVGFRVALLTPEPASLLLLGAGGLVCRRLRRR